MAAIKGTNVAAPVVPLDTTDVHPSHEAKYGKGGYRTVATTGERDAIPAARREAGMLVHVTADGVVYRLGGDLTTWSTFTPPPGVHQHVAADVTDFVSAVVAAAPPTTDASLLTTGTLPDARLSANIARASDVAAASHSHSAADITSGTISIDRLPVGTSSTQVTAGNDARLSNARTPTAHKTSHATGGSDALTAADIGAAAASHTHIAADVSYQPLGVSVVSTDVQAALQEVENAIESRVGYDQYATTTGHGIIQVGTGLSVLDGVVSVSYGSSSTSACVGNDARLSDARTPTAHKTSHATGGGDALTAADIGAAASDHTHSQLHDRSHAITSTSDHTATNWRLFHSNGSGQVVELAFGNSGQALISNGASATPSWGQAGSTSASDLTSGILDMARLPARVRAATNVFNWSSFR